MDREIQAIRSIALGFRARPDRRVFPLGAEGAMCGRTSPAAYSGAGILATVPHCLQRNRRPVRCSSTWKAFPQKVHENAIIDQPPGHPRNFVYSE